MLNPFPVETFSFGEAQFFQKMALEIPNGLLLDHHGAMAVGYANSCKKSEAAIGY